MDDDKYPGIVLAANQMDRPSEEREISTEDGQELAEKWGVSFLEVSAKTGDNIEELFMTAARVATTFKNELKKLHEQRK